MNTEPNTILNQYNDDKQLFEAFKDKIHSILKDLFYVSKIIPHQITCRVKDKDSLAGKIERKKDKYTDLSSITDIIGIRIITYFEDDVDKIANLIEKEFNVDRENSIDKRILETDKFGYRSLHYVVSLSEGRLGLTENKIYTNLKAEIQIRSILQHAWAEIEHDIGYKGENQIPEFARRGFYRIAALLETADIEFVKLKDSLKKYETDVTKEIKTKPENVKLDKASFINYIRNSKLVSDIEEQARVLLNATIVDESSNNHLGMYLERLNYFKIPSIKSLDELLEKYKDQLPKFISKIMPKDSASIPHGLSAFYLAYILATKDEDTATTKSFVDKVLGESDSFVKKLSKAYKDTKTTADSL